MTDTTQTTDPATGTGSADPTITPPSTDGASAAQTGGADAKAASPAKGKAADPAPFYESFTDAKLKESPVVLRHKTVEDLARSLTAAESRLGVPADQLLRKPSKPEDFPEIYKALGAPDSPEGYKIGLPEGASAEDKAVADRFAQTMFEKGPFPPDAVAAAVEFMNGETARADAALAEAQKARQDEGIALLKKELGAKYDVEMTAVGKLLNDIGGPDLAKELDASGAGDNPRLMLFLHKIVDRMGESQGLDGQGRASGGGIPMTPGQAKAARITLENDPVKGPALRDAAHAMHNTVMAERRRLFAYEAGREPDSQEG